MGTTLRQIAAASAVAAALVLLLVACGGDGSDTDEQEAATAGAPQAPDTEQPLSAAESHGRDLFVQTCGACHTLDAAGTIGQIGPDLGDIPLTEGEVLTAIRVGGGSRSKGGGGRSGNMPPNLLTGKDAQDVAAFVAASGPGAGGP